MLAQAKGQLEDVSKFALQQKEEHVLLTMHHIRYYHGLPVCRPALPAWDGKCLLHRIVSV